LEGRRNRADLIEVFKIMRGYSSIPVDSFFEVSKGGRTRGDTYKKMGFLMDLVCRTLWLDQVLHLVQPHQVYDQVYDLFFTVNTFNYHIGKFLTNEIILYNHKACIAAPKLVNRSIICWTIILI